MLEGLKRLFAPRVTITESSSSPMTAEQRAAFDRAFVKLDETFRELDKVFRK